MFVEKRKRICLFKESKLVATIRGTTVNYDQLPLTKVSIYSTTRKS